MQSVTDYINSGILELYVLGITTEEETDTIKQLAMHNKRVQKEINDISRALILYTKAMGTAPSKRVKSILLAKLKRG